MGGLIIVGDEALTPEEYQSYLRRRERERGYDRRRYAKRVEYFREWRARNRERYNAYQREWMRRRRAA